MIVRFLTIQAGAFGNGGFMGTPTVGDNERLSEYLVSSEESYPGGVAKGNANGCRVRTVMFIALGSRFSYPRGLCSVNGVCSVI